MKSLRARHWWVIAALALALLLLSQALAQPRGEAQAEDRRRPVSPHPQAQPAQPIRPAAEPQRAPPATPFLRSAQQPGPAISPTPITPRSERPLVQPRPMPQPAPAITPPLPRPPSLTPGAPPPTSVRPATRPWPTQPSGPLARPPAGQIQPVAPSWRDRSHDHDRQYPPVGRRYRQLPRPLPPIHWHGTDYWFWSGIWYGPAPYGYMVVRPPYGVVVDLLPDFRTLVLLGGITYLYVNGVYYRERPGGGYMVVPSPVLGTITPGGDTQRLFVYPNLGQSPEQQASDEYECHRWATQQSGYDPALAATAQNPNAALRADYIRAQTACLEARGYTVR